MDHTMNEDYVAFASIDSPALVPPDSIAVANIKNEPSKLLGKALTGKNDNDNLTSFEGPGGRENTGSSEVVQLEGEKNLIDLSLTSLEQNLKTSPLISAVDNEEKTESAQVGPFPVQVDSSSDEKPFINLDTVKTGENVSTEDDDDNATEKSSESLQVASVDVVTDLIDLSFDPQILPEIEHGNLTEETTLTNLIDGDHAEKKSGPPEIVPVELVSNLIDDEKPLNNMNLPQLGELRKNTEVDGDEKATGSVEEVPLNVEENLIDLSLTSLDQNLRSKNEQIIAVENEDLEKKIESSEIVLDEIKPNIADKLLNNLNANLTDITHPKNTIEVDNAASSEAVSNLIDLSLTSVGAEQKIESSEIIIPVEVASNINEKLLADLDTELKTGAHENIVEVDGNRKHARSPEVSRDVEPTYVDLLLTRDDSNFPFGGKEPITAGETEQDKIDVSEIIPLKVESNVNEKLLINFEADLAGEKEIVIKFDGGGGGDVDGDDHGKNLEIIKSALIEVLESVENLGSSVAGDFVKDEPLNNLDLDSNINAVEEKVSSSQGDRGEKPSGSLSDDSLNVEKRSDLANDPGPDAKIKTGSFDIAPKKVASVLVDVPDPSVLQGQLIVSDIKDDGSSLAETSIRTKCDKYWYTKGQILTAVELKYDGCGGIIASEVISGPGGIITSEVASSFDGITTTTSEVASGSGQIKSFEEVSSNLVEPVEEHSEPREHPRIEKNDQNESLPVVDNGKAESPKDAIKSCTPMQVLRLLADFEYNFRREEWGLKKESQTNNSDEKLKVVIFGEHLDKGTLFGMGEAASSKMAEMSAALDLCEQFQSQQNLVLPKASISRETRISPLVINALSETCVVKELPSPRFKWKKGYRGRLSTCTVSVGELKKEGMGHTVDAAKIEAANKMYETVTGELFPLVEIIKGESCSGGFDQYELVSNKELPLLKIRLPSRGAIPAGFLASLKPPSPVTENPRNETIDTDVLKPLLDFN